VPQFFFSIAFFQTKVVHRCFFLHLGFAGNYYIHLYIYIYMHQYTSLHTHNIYNYIYILLYRTINYYILGKHCAHKQTVYLVKSKILARKMMFCTHAGSLRNHQTNYTYLRQGSLHFWNPRYLQFEQLSLVNQVKEGCIFRHFRHLPWQIKQS
jgi:hypothetical protein